MTISERVIGGIFGFISHALFAPIIMLAIVGGTFLEEGALPPTTKWDVIMYGTLGGALLCGVVGAIRAQFQDEESPHQ